MSKPTTESLMITLNPKSLLHFYEITLFTDTAFLLYFFLFSTMDTFNWSEGSSGQLMVLRSDGSVREDVVRIMELTVQSCHKLSEHFVKHL